MGHKLVCFGCRKSFSAGTDYSIKHGETCPNCGGKFVLLDQKFKPPKKNDDKQWEIVHYLVEHGFRFQHSESDDEKYVPYPKTLKEAEVFIAKQNEVKQ
jgi:DNA-directed RNA polymerase subunit RPC12/RpoP